MLAKTAENFDIREISATRLTPPRPTNLQAIADLGATPFIPFIRDQTGTRGPQSSLFHISEVPLSAKATA